MAEWTNRKFKDIVTFNPKENIKKSSLAKKVTMDMLKPFCRDITKFEFTEFKGGTKFRNGDTLMARITPCLENGKTAKVNILEDDEIGFGSTEYIVFRAVEGVTNEDFIYYLVCSPIVRNPAIKSMVGSSGRQRVQTDVLQNLEICIPDLVTQCKIGSLLQSLDDKIEINNRINKNLEEQAQ
ncbi:MAG: restriction endonuclease subunit S, partial [Prevotella sp.]|nr:restriction endonuclease subunit S [Alistipes senegalensis]MCM1358292.1 restriction endonuclease subunit S [Prevotella sp.]MCM1474158.1 restriction endonuclease subunit S [Muribaculaceae bacterium]